MIARRLLLIALVFPAVVALGGGELGAEAVNKPASVAAPPSRSDWRHIVTGRLPNGVHFAILPRTGSEPGAGLLMRDEGGFIAERRPGERGLAHLIEHLVFLSPTTGAPDKLHHFLRVGLPLSFPASSVATTTWRETNYFVSTRTPEVPDLDRLLALFREVATDLTFRADAVDEQRADVMREMAGRKAGNDIYARYIAAVAPGSPTDVIDAQNSADVPTASVDTIRALYHRLYRPENMMVVVVGNVDPGRMKALIRHRFGGWQAPGPAPVSPPVPTFQAARIAPISYSGASDGRRVAMITVTSQTLPPPPTRQRQARATLMEMLVIRAVNNRLAAAQPGAPAGKTGLFIENGEQGHRLLMLWDNFAGAGWRPALAGLGRTTCDLRTGGFSDREWDAARQDVLRDLEERAWNMGKVPNVELAKDLSHALAAGRDLIPPDELLRQASQWLSTVNAQTGSDWWRRQWEAGVEHIRVEAPELAQVRDPATEIRITANQGVDRATCRTRLSSERGGG